MSATSARAARREEQTAAVLGVARVHRQRGQSAPDVEAVRLPSGAVLGPEVKSRKRLPRVIIGALAQARTYFGAQAIPLAVVFEFGATDGIACLPLQAFAHLVGLDVSSLPRPTPIRKTKCPTQLDMFAAPTSCPTVAGSS